MNKMKEKTIGKKVLERERRSEVKEFPITGMSISIENMVVTYKDVMFGYSNGNKDHLEKKENYKQETQECTCEVSKRV